MGGHCIHYALADSPLGKKESIYDTAKVVSRYADVVTARAFNAIHTCISKCVYVYVCSIYHTAKVVSRYADVVTARAFTCQDMAAEIASVIEGKVTGGFALHPRCNLRRHALIPANFDVLFWNFWCCPGTPHAFMAFMAFMAF